MSNNNNKWDMESINPYKKGAPFFMRMEHLARYRWAREMMRRRGANVVLDIACAEGYGTNGLWAEGRKVIGVDKNEELIQKARLHYKKCEYHVVDVDENEMAIVNLSPFDAVCCFETLEHVKYPIRMLELLNECLTRDGYMMLSVPNGEYEPLDENGEVLSKYHLHAFSDNQLSKMIERCGFEIEQKLHQHLSSQLYRNFNTVIRDRETTTEEMEGLFPTDAHSLDLLSEVFAWPDDVQGKSYNMIYLCKKV
jgi:2-polyprenyl-3-methyl-5-hydroxy-6-metoxy-1,4-benzoquinol methylase